MNITSWDIYWITRLDGICSVAESLAVLTFAILLVSVIMLAVATAQGLSIPRLFRGWFQAAAGVVFLFLLSVSILTPTTREMATIYVLPPVANGIVNDADVRALPKEIVGLARDWLAELRPVAVRAVKHAPDAGTDK